VKSCAQRFGAAAALLCVVWLRLTQGAETKRHGIRGIALGRSECLVFDMADRAKSKAKRVRTNLIRPGSSPRVPQAGFPPLAEMIDEDNRVEILAAVPGFEASNLGVDVLPRSIDIETNAGAEPGLLCHFELPCAVKTRKTTARLNHGRLTVVAPKQTSRAVRHS